LSACRASRRRHRPCHRRPDHLRAGRPTCGRTERRKRLLRAAGYDRPAFRQCLDQRAGDLHRVLPPRRRRAADPTALTPACLPWSGAARSYRMRLFSRRCNEVERRINRPESERGIATCSTRPACHHPAALLRARRDHL